MDRLDKILLSDNFTLDELIYSRTADIRGIDNYPNQDELDNLILLCESILQPLRDATGAIHVTSGYRGAALNKAIGGSGTSLHSYGLAADIYSTTLNNMELAQYIKDNFEYEELILEKVPKKNPNKGWVHIALGHNGVNNNETMSFIKNSRGKFYYTYGLHFTK